MTGIYFQKGKAMWRQREGGHLQASRCPESHYSLRKHQQRQLPYLRLLDSRTVRQYISNVGLLSHFSCVWLVAFLSSVAHQAPLSMGLFQQEYYSGLPRYPREDVGYLLPATSPDLGCGVAPLCLSCAAPPPQLELGMEQQTGSK